MQHTYDRVTTFLENIEMLVNLTAVGEKNLVGNRSVAYFMFGATSVFIRLFWLC